MADAIVYIENESARVEIAGADLLAPLVSQAAASAANAHSDALVATAVVDKLSDVTLHGKQTAPVTGTGAGAQTHILTVPLPKTGTLTTFQYWSLLDGGTITLRRFTKSGVAGVVSNGDVFTAVGSPVTWTTSGGAGLKTKAVDMLLNEGEYLGFFSSANVLARIAATDPNLRYASDGSSTDNTSVTVSAIVSNVAFQVSAEIKYLVVDKDEVAKIPDFDAQFEALKVALYPDLDDNTADFLLLSGARGHADEFDALVRVVEGIAPSFNDYAIFALTGEINGVAKKGRGPVRVMGGWATGDVTLLNGAALLDDGVDQGFNNTSDSTPIAAQATLPGIQAATQLIVAEYIRPYYQSGDRSSQYSWGIGISSGNRALAGGQTLATGQGISIRADTGTAQRIRGVTKANAFFRGFEPITKIAEFTTTGVKAWLNGAAKTIDSGGSASGDFSPAAVGSTEPDYFWIGSTANASGAAGGASNRMRIIVAIKGATLTNAQAAALDTALKAAAPEPPVVWRLPYPGVEDTEGGYLKSTGKLLNTGGDTGDSGLSRFAEVDPVTGLVTVLSTVFPFGLFCHACVVTHHTNASERAYFYGGRNRYPSTVQRNTIFEYNPATHALTQRAETMPSARDEMGVCWDSQQGVTYGFGGNQGDVAQASIWKHNPTTGVCTTLAATLADAVIAPTAVYIPGAGSGGAGAILIVGGWRSHFGGVPTTDSDVRDVNTAQWFDCGTETITTLGVTTPDRFDGASGVYRASTNKVEIYGGYSNGGGGGSYYNRTLLFDVATQTFSSHATLVMPHAGDDYTLAYDPATETRWLYGVLHPDASSNYNPHQVFFARVIGSEPTMTLMPYS